MQYIYTVKQLRAVLCFLRVLEPAQAAKKHCTLTLRQAKSQPKEANMNTTINQLLTARDTLSRLAERTLPVKQSYRLAKLIKAVNNEMSVYDGERIKLCEKYGTLNQEQKQYDINDKESFVKESTELLNQEVELDVKPIDITELELSAQDILNIEPFVEVVDND